MGETGISTGTPAFMSPEALDPPRRELIEQQILDAKLNDVWAVLVIGFFLLVCRVLLSGAVPRAAPVPRGFPSLYCRLFGILWQRIFGSIDASIVDSSVLVYKLKTSQTCW